MSSHHLSGLSAWLVQRLSAVYMSLFLLTFLAVICCSPAMDYERWHGLLSQPVMSIATIMFFLSLLLHSWVGMRDVILDYAGQFPALRLFLLTLLGGWLIALGIWLMRIMLQVMVQ